AMIPGMKFATVAACPVLGGKVKSIDDGRAAAIKGVRQVVKIDNTVAVVGDNMWAAKQGLAALDIDWDRRDATCRRTQHAANRSFSVCSVPGRDRGDSRLCCC